MRLQTSLIASNGASTAASGNKGQVSTVVIRKASISSEIDTIIRNKGDEEARAYAKGTRASAPLH